MKTYYQFIKSLPENARIKLNAGIPEILTPEEYLKRFENFTRLNPKKEYLKGCQFTILFV